MEHFQLETEAEAALRHFWSRITSDPVDHVKAFFSDPCKTYRETDPFVGALMICTAVSTYCFLMGAITGNDSTVCARWFAAARTACTRASHLAHDRRRSDVSVCVQVYALRGGRDQQRRRMKLAVG